MPIRLNELASLYFLKSNSLLTSQMGIPCRINTWFIGFTQIFLIFNQLFIVKIGETLYVCCSYEFTTPIIEKGVKKEIFNTAPQSKAYLGPTPLGWIKVVFQFFLMFIYFWETEREKTWAGEGQRVRETETMMQAPHCPCRAWHGARTHELWDHDPSWSRSLSELSHPSAPKVALQIFWMLKCCSVLKMSLIFKNRFIGI